MNQKKSLDIGENINELLRDRQSLVDEKKRIEVILATLNTGLALMNQDMAVIWVNAKLREFFPWGDPIGKKCYAFAENRTEPCVGCQALLALQDGTIHSRELQNTVNGCWYHITALPVKDEHGRVVNVLEATTDITGQKQVEEALRASEEKFRKFFTHIPEYCYIVSAEGYIVDVNEAALQALGRVKEELVGKHVSMVYAPESLPKIEELFCRWQEEGQITNEEMVIITKNGTRRTVLLNVGSVRDEDGRILHSTSVQTDITERKRLEERLSQQLEKINRMKERLEAENIYLREKQEGMPGFQQIIGQSEAIEYVLYRVQQVAPTDTTVLLMGETGTGKGRIARVLHEASSRKDKPFVTVNCAALPGNLIESELFGREKGAFTGAEAKQVGRSELADRGTIFLDEIVDLPLELQTKLLRVVEDGEFERLGSPYPVKVDVRIITATNQNIGEAIRARRFREDLFYRLNVFPITIPPLRERPEDIELLSKYFLDNFNKQFRKQITGISDQTMNTLKNYTWPGNVRELMSVIERGVIITTGPVLQLAEAPTISRDMPTRKADGKRLDDLQREHILSTLDETGWKIEGPGGAAQALGINPNTLRTRMKKLGIKRPKISR